MHGGEEAHRSQPLFGQRAPGPLRRIRRRGIEHEEPDEARGMAGDGGCDRGFVARNACDEGRPLHAIGVELSNPAIGKGLGRPGIVPT